MTPPLAIARPAGSINRVARAPDPGAWPDSSYAHEDGAFGSRFDDPRAEYRVLYASSQREGAFAETLARFRIDLHVAAEQHAIERDSKDAGYAEPLARDVVPIEWTETRLLGIARHAGGFVDLSHSDSLAHLRAALAERVLHYGLDDLDAGDIRRRAPRRLTQEVSRYVCEHGHDDPGAAVAGVRYLSRLGDDLVNWVIFEPNEPTDATSEPIDRDDEALRTVLDRSSAAGADDPFRNGAYFAYAAQMRPTKRQRMQTPTKKVLERPANSGLS